MPDGLLGLATALVAIPSVSHHEGPMADAVQAALELCPWLKVERVGDNVVARTQLGRDTPDHPGRSSRHGAAGRRQRRAPGRGRGPPRGRRGRHEGRSGRLPPRGRWPPRAGGGPHLCFYVCEEVEQRFNGLRLLWAERPDLLEGDAAILGEPTGGVVECGCQGVLRVRIELQGATGPHRPPGRRTQRHPSTGAGPRRPRTATTAATWSSTGASTSSNSRPST